MKMMVILFEVIDKEPTLVLIWCVALVIGVGGYLLCRFKYQLLFIVLPVALYLSFGLFQEIHDEFVGPAILQEAGIGYIIQSYLAIIVMIALPIIGAIIRYKKSRALFRASS